ncbi:MAG: GTPase ObgE [Fimbriimonadaceae bacterium]|nr:GTPase ObgE [Fimbriimonadaceae bacterium]
MFLDEVVIELESGRGGDGAVTFHREKHVPRGGPNGADGGRGGDVVLIADHHKRTLYEFTYQKRFQAEHGEKAVGNKNGKDGKDLEIRVPIGTLVYDDETGDLLFDLSADGMTATVCRGGKGGFGNLHYVSSVRQVPKFGQKGAPEESLRARLELKLLADVGLVGLPNAGKSTLIGAISAAKPKIGAYPFTTIVPNLGVVAHRDQTFVVADMPGLIEGASEGVGLGHQFLKHIERTRVLVHLVDVLPMDQTDPVANFKIVEKELERYHADLCSKPRLVALTKVELVDDELRELMAGEFETFGLPVFCISAVTGYGLPALLDALASTLVEVEERGLPPAAILRPVTVQPADDWEVVRTSEGYELYGKRILRMVSMTDLENDEAVMYLHRRLVRIGVIDRLRELGAEEGDTVFAGTFVFTYTDEL